MVAIILDQIKGNEARRGTNKSRINSHCRLSHCCLVDNNDRHNSNKDDWRENRIVLSLMLAWLSCRSCHVYDTTTTTTTTTITKSIFRRHFIYRMYCRGGLSWFLWSNQVSPPLFAIIHNNIRYDGRG